MKGVHKRRMDEDVDEDVLVEEEGRKRKAAWGSRLKSYPTKGEEEEDEQEDLDDLLRVSLRIRTRCQARMKMLRLAML